MEQVYLEHCVYNWGIKSSVVNKTFLHCIKEADYLGQKNNSSFIKEMMFDILCSDNKLCAERFIESKEPDFQKFIDSLMDEEIVSTDFSPEVRPEGNLDLTYLDDEKEHNL
jgi:hypothetical protein